MQTRLAQRWREKLSSGCYKQPQEVYGLLVWGRGLALSVGRFSSAHLYKYSLVCHSNWMNSGEVPGPTNGGSYEQDIVSNLELTHLVRLNDILEGPWMYVIRSERLARERSLDALRTYFPEEIDMPAYTGADEYLASARTANFVSAQSSDAIKLQPQKKATQGMARDYVANTATHTRLLPLMRSVDAIDLGVFFGSNLFGVVGTAYSVVLRSFELERNALLRRHFPGINLMSPGHLESSVREMPILPAQIEAARADLFALPPKRAPYPDFFRLGKEPQAEIIQALGNEWEELCHLLYQVDPKSLGMHIIHLTAPLAYLPVSALREAIDSNPRADSKKICSAFLRRPTEFQRNVARFKVQAAAAALLRAESLRWAAAAGDSDTTQSAEPHEELEFIRYDHALIVVNERRFCLPVDQPSSRLAARVLQALAQAGNKPYIEGRALAKTIWSEISLTERKLYTSKASDLQKRSGVIDKAVLDILRQLTNRMGITRETSNEKFKLEQRSSVSLEQVPPDEVDLTRLIPIFPPNTLREKIYEFSGDTIPDEALTTAAEVLQNNVFGNAACSQSQALGLLSFIADRNGKRALRAQLEVRDSDLTLESTLDYLHNKIHRILGEAYASSYQNRMVAGNIATGQHKVKHVSGDLPIITKRDLSPVIKRW